jgi:pimeloyl-ACP methyl ester carboxylesterase
MHPADDDKDESPLAHTRAGNGEPLVLLHGLGSSRFAWNPVTPLLTEDFDVIAIDLPGFGDSAPLSGGAEPHPAAIAAVVAQTLDVLGIDSPHLAGNSLGGWVALELAALTPVRSITLLSPAGLWRDHTPLYNRIALTVLRVGARFGGFMLRPLARFRAARWAIFRLVVGQPTLMTAAHARRAIDDLGTSSGFRATLRASLPRAYVGGQRIEAPVSVSFGTRDLILLTRQSRHLDNLPRQTIVRSLEGTGHVPMTDDPCAIAALIEDTARPSSVEKLNDSGCPAA